MAFPVFIPLAQGAVVGLAAYKAREDDPSSKPFATDPKYRTRAAAVANYVEHVRSMGWPEDLTEVLEIEATFSPGNDAEAVYLHMLREGPVILEDMQYSVPDVRNWEKNQNWLREAAEASGATTQALQEASTTAIIGQTVRASASDARSGLEFTGRVLENVTETAKKGAETAARNPWPTVIGIGLVVYALRRAKVI